MKLMVRKWGNSASVRIPAPVMAAARLSLNQEVVVREEGGRIIIEPVIDDAAALAAMVDAITPENLHEPVACGPARGGEAW